MKRSSRIFALAAGTSALLASSPAFAQTYEDDAAGAAIGMGFLVCYGVMFLVLLAIFIWWIFMTIDAFKRQEYEFPNSSGNSKTTWLVVLLVGWAIGFLWLVTPIYYFMIYKKAPKPGSGARPAAPAGYAAPAAPAAPSAYPPPPSAPVAPPAAPVAPPAAPVAPPAAPVAPPAPPVPPAAPAEVPPAPPAPPAPPEAPSE